MTTEREPMTIEKAKKILHKAFYDPDHDWVSVARAEGFLEGCRRTVMSKFCNHCGGNTAIRLPNPKSGCDHLYYPENCPVCRLKEPRRDTNELFGDIERLLKENIILHQQLGEKDRDETERELVKMGKEIERLKRKLKNGRKSARKLRKTLAH